MTNENSSWQTAIKEQEFNDLLMEWNSRINLVSRKKRDVLDLIEDSKLFFEKINFEEGIKILDLGTGGGFPGIILAIHHPEIQIILVDSIAKKIKVVDDVIKRLALSSAKAVCSRVEELSALREYNHQFDYVVARSVAVLQDLALWSKDLLKPGGKLVTVKGGEISGEINKTRRLGFVSSVEVFEKDERLIVTVRF